MDPLDSQSLLDDPALKQPEGTLYAQEFWGISRHELLAGAAEGLLSASARAVVDELVVLRKRLQSDGPIISSH